MAFWYIYVDKGSNSVLLLHEIKNFKGKMAISSKIMATPTNWAISNSMSSFVPAYWLNLQILLAIFNEFLRQRWDQ